MTASSCLLLASPRLERGFPRGVVQIAGFLRDHDREVEVLSLAHALGERRGQDPARREADAEALRCVLSAAVERTDPSVVGIGSAFSLDYPDCLEALEIVRAIAPKAVTVIGGPHPTFQDAETLDSSAVDVVVRGEGEWTMLALLRALEQGDDLSSVAGISFRRDGRVVRTPDRPPGDLATLPPLDFDLLPADFMRTTHVHGITSRGCSYRCAYCAESAFWRGKRRHPVPAIVDEMETLERRFGNPVVGFMESMVDTRDGQLIELCEEIERRGLALPPRFYAHVRADRLDARGVDAMRRAGIRRVNMGVESASPRVLAMMDRSVTPDQVTAACRLLREHDIAVHTYWIVGHPGDSPAEAEISYRFLKELLEGDLTQSAEAMLFEPHPGTRFYDAPEDYGIEILERDWRLWNRFSGVPVCSLREFPADEMQEAWRRMDRLIRTWAQLGSVDLSGTKRVPAG